MGGKNRRFVIVVIFLIIGLGVIYRELTVVGDRLAAVRSANAPATLQLAAGLEGLIRAVHNSPLLEAPAGPPLAKWVQLIPSMDGRDQPAILVRAVVPGDRPCPKLALDPNDDPQIAMAIRANPRRQAGFFINVCQTVIAPTSDSARVYFPDGASLRLPGPGSLRQIVLFGDSGCRGPLAKQTQHCAPKDWPFAQIARSAGHVADSTNAQSLVVHLGDYMYRDDESWNVWYHDFFEPAAPLLAAAPWLMIRGNHESCTFNDHSGANGWFLLLAPTADLEVKQCPTGPKQPVQDVNYTLKMAPWPDFAVIDSAESYNLTLPQLEFGAKFKASVASLAIPKTTWIFTHVPLLGLADKTMPSFRLGAVEMQAILTAGIKSSEYIISGDSHFLQYIYGDSGPRQLIVGSGGVALDDEQPEKCDGTYKIKENLREFMMINPCWDTYKRYGYVLACRDAANGDRVRFYFVHVAEIDGPGARAGDQKVHELNPGSMGAPIALREAACSAD